MRKVKLLMAFCFNIFIESTMVLLIDDKKRGLGRWMDSSIMRFGATVLYLGQVSWGILETVFFFVCSSGFREI